MEQLGRWTSVIEHGKVPIADDFCSVGVRTEEEDDSNLFGVTYRFSLVDAVEGCKEPLAHFGALVRRARRHGLKLHVGPKPLTEVVEAARGTEATANADAGRLRRIYFYKGGMDCTSAAAPLEHEVLRLFSAFAFRKVDGGEGGGAVSPADGGDGTCRWLADCLDRLHRAEGGSRRLPRCSEDIVDARLCV
eukprot:TRINITY_DN24385_c0_g3_i2.p3 TRINITY_DN24385_c0_g3~~TRINITY_DN24385_c0_g3_i2.p3  ORF type:complete len:191 (-),score=35.31 TRINITY_DN24385_c0_g3_i2:64-636(-)